MTFEDALEKRDEARTRRRSFRRNDGTSLGILSAEYDWGYWEAVVTIMKNCGIKDLGIKEVQ
jgi:hypothetical protein